MSWSGALRPSPIQPPAPPPTVTGRNNLTMSSPTNVETRWPPIRARGCAASSLGEPSTVTIEVAKGILNCPNPLQLRYCAKS
jgi:hypothetical protein